MKNFFIGTVLLLTISIPASAKFSYEGFLQDSSGNPILTASVNIKLAIKAMNGCVLHEETQTVSTLATGGYFSVIVGGPAATITYPNPGGATVDTLFRNGILFNGNACSATPAAGEARKLHVNVDSGSGYESFGDIEINPAPSALYAEKIGKHSENSVMRVESSGNPSNIPALSGTEFSSLVDLINGSSTQYAKNDSTNGTALVTTSVDPSTPAPGALWFDTTSNVLKFRDNGTVRTISNPVDSSYAAKGIVQFDTDAATSGIVLSAGVAKLANSGVTPGTYGSSTQIPQFTVDSFGRVVSISTVTVSGGGGGITDLTGDISASGSGSVPATISTGAVTAAKLANDAVNTSKILDASVTFAKIQDISTAKLLGRSTAGAGDVEQLSVGAGLSLSGGTLSAMDGLSGLGCASSDVAYFNGSSWACKPMSSANTINTIVSRDSSGNILAGTGQFSTAVKVTDGAAGGQVTIAAPSAFSSYVLTMPIDDGNAGQVLQSNGAGILSWATMPAAAPAALSLDGSSQMTGQILAKSSSSAGAPAYSFAGGAGNGMFYAGSNALGFAANSTERMRIDSTGNVGIGTVSPVEKLDVLGNIKAEKLILTSTATVGSACSVNGMISHSAGKMMICDGTNWVLAGPWTLSSGKYFMPSGNSVGFGEGNPAGVVQITNNSGVISDPVLTLKGMSGQTGHLLDAKSSSGISKAVITGDGKVGIGVTAPQAALEIKGHISSVPVAPPMIGTGGCGAAGAAFDTTGGVQATDTRGTVIIGSSPSGSTCTVTFGEMYNTPPTCVVSYSGVAANYHLGVSTTTSTMTIHSSTFTASNKINYICIQ